ncbi:MAG: response regulator [Magnetospirillum sp.]|nr:response regulator [Magnetospirillum sp.]
MTRNPVKFGIKGWLLVLALVGALPAIGFAGVVAAQLAQAERHALLGEVRQRTDALGGLIDRHLETAMTVAAILSESPHLAERDLAAFHRDATRVIERYRIGDNVVVVDRNGRQLANTRRPFGTALPPAGHQDLTDVFAGHAVVTGLFTGTVQKTHRIAVLVPVWRGAEVAYALALGFDPAEFSQLLREQGLPGGWVGVVVDRTGTIVARTHAPERYVGEKAVPDTLRGLAGGGPRGTYRVQVKEGVPMTAAYVTSPLSGWSVAVGAPLAQLEAPAWNSIRALLLLGLVMVGTGGLLAFLFARHLTSQAAAVTRAAVALGEGGAVTLGRSDVAEFEAIADGLGVARDMISARDRERDRLTAEALAAKAAAEREALARSKFLAAASHDLRQPVQSLVLLIEVLHGRVADPSVQKVTAQMEQALQALRLLLNSILDLSRLDAGIVVPDFQPVALGPKLARLGEEYRLRGTDEGIAVRVVATSAVVRSDPTLLERALRNLIENALRYAPAGRILIGCRRRGSSVRIDVLDTGIGIAPRDLDSIFDEFHQVSNPARDRAQGLGLGLAIVRRLMTLLGGRIEVASEPGRGSRFSLLLPSTAAAAAAGASADIGRHGQGQAVLVIEDDAILRGSLVTTLEAWGYRPRDAASGAEAMAVVAGGFSPAAVIADYRLPGPLTGPATLDALRATLDRAVPAVIITGDTAPERIQEVSGSGLTLLHKPVAPEDLRRVLTRLVVGA